MEGSLKSLAVNWGSKVTWRSHFARGIRTPYRVHESFILQNDHETYCQLLSTRVYPDCLLFCVFVCFSYSDLFSLNSNNSKGHQNSTAEVLLSRKAM